MADITLGVSSNRAPASSGLAHTLRTFFAGLRDGIDAHRRYNALAAMSRRDLRDLGLTRADIGREAMFPTRRIAR